MGIWTSGLVPTQIEEQGFTDQYLQGKDIVGNGKGLRGSLVGITQGTAESHHIPMEELESHLNLFYSGSRKHVEVLESHNASIGGFHPKLTLHLDANGDYYTPSLTKPANVILKPATIAHGTIAHLEHATLKLAKLCGLESANSQINHTAQGTAYIVIERFDNTPNGRLSQEDLAQILGIPGKDKDTPEVFQAVVPVLNQLLPESEVHIFLQQILFNTLVGNTDAHLRNFSIHGDLRKMTPLYDSFPTMLLKDSYGFYFNKYVIPLGDITSAKRSIKEEHIVALADYLGFDSRVTVQYVRSLAHGITTHAPNLYGYRYARAIVKRLHYLL